MIGPYFCSVQPRFTLLGLPIVAILIARVHTHPMNIKFCVTLKQACQLRKLSNNSGTKYRYHFSYQVYGVKSRVLRGVTDYCLDLLIGLQPPVQLLRGRLRPHQPLRRARQPHKVSKLEAEVQVLQHVALPGWDHPLRGGHVHDGLEDRPGDLHHRHLALHCHPEEPARCQLGLVNPVPSFPIGSQERPQPD